MARGRKQTPTAIKLLRGGPSPADTGEPTFDGKPVMPAWLTPKAKTEWRRIVPKLIKLGVATEADQAALVAYCEACARLQEAVKMIQLDGAVIATDNGSKKMKHPATMVFNSAADSIMRVASEFGMTPASRPKIHAKIEDTKSDLERFMGGG